MKQENKHSTRSTGENDIPCPEELFEKARLVQEGMTAFRKHLEQSVFAGTSKDGLLRIDLYGDGRPHSVSFLIPLPEEEKKLFENEIFEALDDAYQCRVSQMQQELDAIQNQLGVGPGFQMPF